MPCSSADVWWSISGCSSSRCAGRLRGPSLPSQALRKLLRGQRATVTIQAQHNSLKMGIFQVFTYNMGIQCPYAPTIPLRKYLAQHLKTHISLAANVLQGFRKNLKWLSGLAPWNQAIEPLNPRVGYRTSLWSWLGFDQIVSHYIGFKRTFCCHLRSIQSQWGKNGGLVWNISSAAYWMWRVGQPPKWSTVHYIRANYNNSLTWNKAIWGWFPWLTMIPVRSQWGRYNLPRLHYLEDHPYHPS